MSCVVEGTHGLSLTIVRARDVAGGDTAVQMDHGHLPTMWFSLVDPPCGVRARALCVDRGLADASKPHSRTQGVVLDVWTGELRVMSDSTKPRYRVGVLVGTFGWPRGR